jgi:hypothetical protein
MTDNKDSSVQEQVQKFINDRVQAVIAERTKLDSKQGCILNISWAGKCINTCLHDRVSMYTEFGGLFKIGDNSDDEAQNPSCSLTTLVAAINACLGADFGRWKLSLKRDTYETYLYGHKNAGYDFDLALNYVWTPAEVRASRIETLRHLIARCKQDMQSAQVELDRLEAES